MFFEIGPVTTIPSEWRGEATKLMPNRARSKKGVANTFMAYQLLMVLNYLDENGIRVDVATEPIGPFVSKTDALNSIGATLDSGYNNLNSAGNAFNFTLTSGFANFNTPATFAQFNRALRARVAAFAGDYQGILDALAHSFIDANAPMTYGAYHDFGTGSGDRTNQLYESPSAEFVKWMAHPTFAEEAEPGDARVASKVIERDPSTTYDALTSAWGITLFSSSTSPMAIIRNEELLLLRAEANIGLGDLPSAEADINHVRAAAGLDPVTLSDAEQAVDQLLFERRYSLFGEGHRWVDMRRYGRLDQLPVDRPGDSVVEMMPVPFNERDQ